MFGYERSEVIGRNLRTLMPHGEAERHDAYIANYLETGVGKVIGVGREMEGRRKNGAQFPIDLSIVEAAVEDHLMFVGFVHDLTEQRRIDSRIDHLAAQRLSAIGGMAGALAHEINQPLAAIGVYLETARRMLQKSADPRGTSVENAIGRALTQVERMGDIIGHLRDFVGHGEADKTSEPACVDPRGRGRGDGRRQEAHRCAGAGPVRQARRGGDGSGADRPGSVQSRPERA